MQSDSSGGNGGGGRIPLKLQDVETTHEFPPHIANILNPGKTITILEIMCRLIHVCMIEAGFIPIIEEEQNMEVESLCEMTMKDSIPKLVQNLQRIIDKVGNLHNVNYKAVILESSESTDREISSNESTTSLDLGEYSKLTVGAAFSGSIPVTSIDSGDGSAKVTINGENKEDAKHEVVDFSTTVPQQTEIKKVFSESISVNIIHEGLSIFVIASGPGFHKNAQVSLPQYIRPNNNENFPQSAKAEEYLRLMTFTAIRFSDDVKRGFCYPIMDELDALSFEIRSLAWLPPEMIVEIAKRCSAVMVHRLRATCTHVRNALSENNQQLWKMLLKRDFPQYNIDNLKAVVSPNKFYRKYTDMCSFTFRRPPRRTLGQGRLFSYYLWSL